MIAQRVTRDSKIIKASQKDIYNAFINPEALAVWLAPGEMTGKVHHFDPKVGGGYQMSLYYPTSEEHFRGKTAEKEDRFIARFLELKPFEKIVQAINFVSEDPAFQGEMIMDVTLKPESEGTLVSFEFTNIPAGIRLEDNKAGTQSTLKKLALYVE